MRADIHDGPEHNTLQSEAGYIDAMQDRICQVDETSCNARPDHTSGSKTEVSALPRDVCFTSQSRHQLSATATSVRANKRLSHYKKGR
jgi:hypothetical protein